ncbi:MAG TPA: hypothetical protein VGL51_16080 [Solirubrobacteraceae bacterium]|jgi:hypothetical protein
MKLKRRNQPQVDPDFVELIAGIYYAFEDNLERCRRLTAEHRAGGVTTEQHREALDGARRLAYVSRVTFDATMNLGLTKQVSEEFLPVGVLGALARLAYALTALAEEECEPEALLTPAELNGLTAQYDIANWVEYCRSRNPDMRAEDP